MTEPLLNLPPHAGQLIVEANAVFQCPLLGTDSFLKFCDERGIAVSRERLFRLEKLSLFSPVFRVRLPEEEHPPFRIPISSDSNWFELGYAFDTTAVPRNWDVPDLQDELQEGYYSQFQVEYLRSLLASFDLRFSLDSLLDDGNDEAKWIATRQRWVEAAQSIGNAFRTHHHRRARALLCQLISERYYPQTQTDQRTITISSPSYSDKWITALGHDRDWQQTVRSWDPTVVERIFGLTSPRLRGCYEALAVVQANVDPIEHWYQLVQFVAVSERARLKGRALLAETMRAGAQMLRMLYKDLYKEDLPSPNEVSSVVITHIPELEVRKDPRRYLEFVANRFGVNPQPKLCLIVEGASEELAVHEIFEKLFGLHPGKLSIEVIVLGGVDNATGSKEDRFRAIIRLIDYLHHHQTITFLILDNERYARKLKAASKDAKSIHHGKRFVTRPEYIKVWRRSWEFDNFSAVELARAVSSLADGAARISAREVLAAKAKDNPGAALEALFEGKTGKKLNKLGLTASLLSALVTKPRPVSRRPMIATLERVYALAARNPLPTMRSTWETNQASKYLGKKRGGK